MKRVQCLVLHFVLIAGASAGPVWTDDGHTHRNDHRRERRSDPQRESHSDRQRANERRQTVTNQAGEYTLPFLPPVNIGSSSRSRAFTTVVPAGDAQYRGTRRRERIAASLRTWRSGWK